jgi:hypothetical protein
MRWRVLILSASLFALAGCSSESHPKPLAAAATTQPIARLEESYEPALASALVFTPPISINDPPVELSRADREPGAFVGFEDQTRSFLYVRTEDRYSSDGQGRFERRSIVEQLGSTTR